MAEFSITPQDLAQLARLVEENGLSELRYEEGDLRITLRTGEHLRASAPVSVPVVLPYAVESLEKAANQGATITGNSGEGEYGDPDASFGVAHSDDDRLRIEAPIMGVFYRRPAQDQPPFIDVGDMIEAGQTIGMIEAMKVFSEVPSEVAGRVVAIPAQNGALVQPGDPLVVLEAAEGG